MSFPAPHGPPPQNRSRGTLAWLVGAQGLLLLSLVPWFFAAALSLVALEDTADPWGRWVFMGVVWSYPLLPLACSVVAWRAYARQRWRRAAVFAALPLVPALPLLVYLFWLATPA